MHNSKALVGFALLTCTLAASRARAAVPQTITQQGRLLNADGTPVTAQVTMVFSVYDSTSATTPKWTETQAVAPDVNGYFSVQLGAVTAFPTTPPLLWDGTTRYLGVKINSDPEMTPREQITSVPYALVANDATGDIHPTSVTVNGVTVINSSGQLPGATLPCSGCVNSASIASGAVTSAEIATGTLKFTPTVTFTWRNGTSAGPIAPGSSAYATASCQSGEALVSAFCNPFNTGMTVYTANLHPEANPPYASCGCQNPGTAGSSQTCSANVTCASFTQMSIP